MDISVSNIHNIQCHSIFHEWLLTVEYDQKSLTLEYESIIDKY